MEQIVVLARDKNPNANTSDGEITLTAGHYRPPLSCPVLLLVSLVSILSLSRSRSFVIPPALSPLARTLLFISSTWYRPPRNFTFDRPSRTKREQRDGHADRMVEHVSSWKLPRGKAGAIRRNAHCRDELSTRVVFLSAFFSSTRRRNWWRHTGPAPKISRSECRLCPSDPR